MAEHIQRLGRDSLWEPVRNAFGAAGFVDQEPIDALRRNPDRLSTLAGALIDYAAVNGLEINARQPESLGARRHRWELLREDNGTYPLEVLEEMRLTAIDAFRCDEPASKNAQTFTRLMLQLRTEDEGRLTALDLRQADLAAFAEKTLYEYFRQCSRGLDDHTSVLNADSLRLYLKGVPAVEIQRRLNTTSDKSTTQFRVRMRRRLLDATLGVQVLRQDFARYLTDDQQARLPVLLPEYYFRSTARKLFTHHW